MEFNNWLSKLGSLFTKESKRLLVLAEVVGQNAGHYAYTGVQNIPLSQIRGTVSTGRAYEFDSKFRMLRDHGENRWSSVASALQRGRRLPPVALVQVGETYFVQDGHHRVSVAYSLGQTDIEAEVTVWQILPAAAPAAAPLAVAYSA